MLLAAFVESVAPPPIVPASGERERRSAPSMLSLTLAYGADTAETAQENLRALARRCNGSRRPLVIDLRMTIDQTEGARLCYRHTLAHLAGPVAIVVGTNVSRFLGEFLARALRPRHVAKLFVNEERARAWVLEMHDTL